MSGAILTWLSGTAQVTWTEPNSQQVKKNLQWSQYAIFSGVKDDFCQNSPQNVMLILCADPYSRLPQELQAPG